MANTRDEMLDIVDDDDRVIGHEWKSVIYKWQMKNYRVINAFLKDQKGRLWIPRRSGGRLLFPLCLDVSIGGHVRSGETYEMALKREAMEEVNMDLGEEAYTELGYLTPASHQVSAFMRVYEINADRTPNYDRSGIVEAFWLRPEEIIRKLERNDRAKDDLPRLIEVFYMC